MEKAFQKLKSFLLSNDSWLYLSVFFILAVERTVNIQPHSWQKYLYCLTTLIFLYLPLLAFTYKRRKLTEKLSFIQYTVLWGSVFIGYSVLLVGIMEMNFSDGIWYLGKTDYFIGVGFALFAIDIGVQFEKYWQKEAFIISWFKRIGIDKALLICMGILSVIVSMMIVSDLQEFRSHERIHAGIHLGEVGKHWFLFLSYAFQLFLVYATLYFFYLLNARLLIPILLKKRGILIYIIGSAGSIALFFPILAQFLISLPITQEIPSIMPDGTLRAFTELNATLPFIVFICSLPAIVALQWFKQNQDIAELESQRVTQELSLLKQQINPHFFFNTLNNLYSLSLEKSDKSPQVILQLSELMRYVIYKGKEKEVPLKEEIAYIKDYIELQRIRLFKKFDLIFDEDLTEDAMHIPPLLLINLVENAFKHGIEPAEKACFLHIYIKSSSNELKFTCVNSFETSLSEGQGIGLANLSRRLELVFPSHHDLNTRIEGHTFISDLQIWKSLN